jgi:hypothetical protein
MQKYKHTKMTSNMPAYDTAGWRSYERKCAHEGELQDNSLQHLDNLLRGHRRRENLEANLNT